jgi:hypothetical protein
MGIRGGRAFKELLLFDVPAAAEPDEESRGRSAELLALRNEHIFHRYIYHTLEGKGKYLREYIIEQLVAEFYLSKSTLGQLLDANVDEIMRIRREWPSTKELNAKYPPPKWTTP